MKASLSQKPGLIQEISEQTNIFGDSLIFSVVTGSHAYGMARADSDMDIMTVVNPIDSTPESVIEFAQQHVELQLKYGLKPDYVYPTDVISNEQLKDTVNGRSIVDENGKLVEDETPRNYEFDYYVWLYELITHDFGILAGELKKLEEATGEALRTALLICAMREKYSKIGLDAIRSDIVSPTGKKLTLNQKQTEILLSQIHGSSFSSLRRGVIDIDQEQARIEVKKLLSRPRQSEYIVPWSELTNALKDQ